MKLISLVIVLLFAGSAFAVPTQLTCSYGALKTVCDTRVPGCPPASPVADKFLSSGNTSVVYDPGSVTFTGYASASMNFDLYGKSLYVFAKSNFSGDNDQNTLNSKVEIQIQDLDTGWVSVVTSENSLSASMNFGRVDRIDSVRTGFIRSTIYCQLLP